MFFAKIWQKQSSLLNVYRPTDIYTIWPNIQESSQELTTETIGELLKVAAQLLLLLPLECSFLRFIIFCLNRPLVWAEKHGRADDKCSLVLGGGGGGNTGGSELLFPPPSTFDSTQGSPLKPIVMAPPPQDHMLH